VRAVSSNSLFSDHAEIYAEHSTHSGPNAYYERPAILRLAGEVAGLRVLELGCAGGVLTEMLIDRGADVTAVDREPRLVELAQQRIGQRGRAVVADLEEPLDMVPTASVDLVIASLVLHYIADWRPLLSELYRCLVPGGGLVFSLHHPITGWRLSDQADYHRTELIRERWDLDGHEVTASMYRRSFSEVFGPLRAAGFTIDAVEEPQPVEGAPITDDLMQTLKTAPVFLFVHAERSA
jgi:SAM-dependent methyltransferase